MSYYLHARMPADVGYWLQEQPSIQAVAEEAIRAVMEGRITPPTQEQLAARPQAPTPPARISPRTYRTLESVGLPVTPAGAKVALEDGFEAWRKARGTDKGWRELHALAGIPLPAAS